MMLDDAAKRVRRAALGFAMLCLVPACVGDSAPKADWGNLTGETRKLCPGAFTPGSDECWDPDHPTPDQPITANSATTQELAGDVSGQDRCAVGAIVGMPGVEGTLEIKFLTTLLRGQYGPANCGAVWVEDSFMNHVRTLEVWAEARRQSVVQWSLRGCDMEPLPEAISRATLTNHEQHTSKWDMKDWRGAVVPDGEYTIWIQVTENEIAPEGPIMRIPFLKNSTPRVNEEYMPPSDDPVEGIVDVFLTYTPGPAAPGATAP